MCVISRLQADGRCEASRLCLAGGIAHGKHLHKLCASDIMAATAPAPKTRFCSGKEDAHFQGQAAGISAEYSVETSTSSN